MGAYRSIRVGASVQEQPNHLQTTPHSGDDKGGVSILAETDKKRVTMSYSKYSYTQLFKITSTYA